jgi:hypothetical protein
MAFVGGPSTEGPGSVSQKFLYFLMLPFQASFAHTDAVNLDVRMRN